MSNHSHTLGITVCYTRKTKVPPFFEQDYFYQLMIAAKKKKIDLIVFNPQDVDWSNRKVLAWKVTPQKRWYKESTLLPSLIYDRCYYTSTPHYLQYKPYVNRLAQDKHIQLLGKPLSGKLQTHSILQSNPQIRPYLPETKLFSSFHDLKTMLKNHGSICLKPNGGSHGRGVVAISSREHGYQIRGRDTHNRPFQLSIHHHDHLQRWAQQFISKTRYIMQPYLDLTTNDGVPFDMRILIQKNGEKQWLVTGVAIRTGNPKSITSNLHGGGKALSWHRFCAKEIPNNHREEISQKIKQCAKLVPPHIEKNYGPLVELGLDIGIDRNGDVWILEVNSKPGRSVFLHTGNMQTHQLAIEQPIHYAQTILTSIQEV